MMTMEALRVHNALTAPIPQPSEGIAFASSLQPKMIKYVFFQLMMTMEALRVHNALTAPIPQPSEGIAFTSSLQPTDDEQITEATLLSSIRQMPVGAWEKNFVIFVE